MKKSWSLGADVKDEYMVVCTSIEVMRKFTSGCGSIAISVRASACQICANVIHRSSISQSGKTKLRITLRSTYV